MSNSNEEDRGPAFAPKWPPLNHQLDGKAIRGQERALTFIDQRPLELKVAMLTRLVQMLLEHAPERVRERALSELRVGVNRS